MTQHLCRCDKCGTIENMVLGQLPGTGYKEGTDYYKEIAWHNTEIGDLCPKCYKAYVAHRDKFMEEK